MSAMSDTSIARKILDSAREKAQAVLDGESRKQEQLERSALAALETEMAEKRDAARKRLHEVHQQALSAFRLTETNRIHALRRKLLDGIYAGAWDAAARPEAYRAYLERQIRETCREGDTLVVPAGHRALFQSELKELLASRKISLAEEQGSFRAGFIAVRGSTRLNCSLDERFKATVRDTEIAVAKSVFGK
jgi:vacuolar-type H+-ATPase subunit E/Vma4